MAKTHNIVELKELQKKWADRVCEEALVGPIRTIAGADVAFTADGQECIAGIVHMKYPEMAVLEKVQAKCRLDFPYIPGLLSFREAPAVLAAAKKLSQKPDILILDGQGRAHPRRFGLACHVGLELGWSTIGCAKSRLIGTHRPVGQRKGCRCQLIHEGEVVGKALRSRSGVKCLYVSVGHKVILDEAVRIVLRCCHRYRIPEPARLAHQMVTNIRLSTSL